MKMITVGVDCLKCTNYKEINLLKGECMARNKSYWIGHKIQCDDMEVIRDGYQDQEDERTGEDTDEGQ